MWTSFSIDSKQYYLHSNYEKGLFSVRLTELISAWKGIYSSETIVERFKECNSIDGTIEVHKILNVFDTDLNPQNPDVIKIIKNYEGKLELNLASHSKDISFYFTLTLDSPEEFCRDITLPLILIIQELKERQEKLKQIVKEKDDEITEYRLEEAKLFRSYLRTNKFDDASFSKECSLETESNLKKYVSSLDKVFDSELNTVYSSAIKICKKNALEKSAVGEEANLVAGTIGNHPPDLMMPVTEVKLQKWELEPQNVKRFKVKRPKINL